MTLTIHDQFDQGSQQWLQARCGLLTASEVKMVVAPPPAEETRVKKNGEPYKQREWNPVADNDAVRQHIYELAAQRITRFVEPVYQTNDMIRGHIDEEEACALYHQHHAPVRAVGFITNNKWGFTLGYSPDRLLVNENAAVEAKSRKQKYQVQTVIEHLQSGGVPAEFVMQVQTGMLVAELDWVDFISFSAKLPMAVIRVHPDDKIQAAILEAAAAAEERIATIVTQFQDATAFRKAA